VGPVPVKKGKHNQGGGGGIREGRVKVFSLAGWEKESWLHCRSAFAKGGGKERAS